MATLYITEYARVAFDPNGPLAMPEEPPLASQTVAIGSGSVASNAFNVATRFVRLNTDAACSIQFGFPTPTAVATTARMAANQTEYHGVPQGGGYQVAVITNS